MLSACFVLAQHTPNRDHSVTRASASHHTHAIPLIGSVLTRAHEGEGEAEENEQLTLQSSCREAFPAGRTAAGDPPPSSPHDGPTPSANARCCPASTRRRARRPPRAGPHAPLSLFPAERPTDSHPAARAPPTLSPAQEEEAARPRRRLTFLSAPAMAAPDAPPATALRMRGAGRLRSPDRGHGKGRRTAHAPRQHRLPVPAGRGRSGVVW